MKQIMCLILVLSQTACVSAYFPDPEVSKPAPQYSNEMTTHKWFNERQAANAEKWKKWDKKYVNEDVILVEIITVDGQSGTPKKPK